MTDVELRLAVDRRALPAEGVVALDLRSVTGEALPAWTPGAHIDLCSPSGLVRQYSLCGDPSDNSTWRIAVLREPSGRGGSAWVHNDLHAGTAVDVRGPRNHFSLEVSESYVFIAGGIGITPILPMLAEAERAGADWVLHYGGRTRKSMAFASALVEKYGDRVILYPGDGVGLIPIGRILGQSQPNTLVYCCGPEPLLQATEAQMARWPSDALHVERFAPRVLSEPSANQPFDVELARSGITVTVPPDRSVLDVVQAAGVQVLSSCEEGTCGTCETAVLEGIVDHRDSILTTDEQDANDVMFICVSRAAGPRLVVDL